MDLNKILDYAIMEHEISQTVGTEAGYIINGRTYNNYLSNDSFKKFVDDMKQCNPTAYDMYKNGGGKELDERKSGSYIYPPKMASFGSSSRMIYNLMSYDKRFLFEKKQPTTIGGMSNLDGFMETDEKLVFVEAKCREPYTAKNDAVEIKYLDLYNAINKSDKTTLSCNIEMTDKGKMKVTFKSNNVEIHLFDIKQMICHLLGIATVLLKDGGCNKQIEFIYLFFNPKLIEIKEGREKIYSVYDQTCKECYAVDFNSLFAFIVEYLHITKGMGTDKAAFDITNSFSFKLCDQSNMKI